uniref:23S rRNA (guanosine-2'-O-)-methyltransferase RlmB n=1 Tax=Candidatus Kentrum sp. TC TaxID=2126339 RepID=A0A450Z064_9GAMM|nr:MAG: rRNA methylase, putative, group 3 [Candidatus Kentron sp. TC]
MEGSENQEQLRPSSIWNAEPNPGNHACWHFLLLVRVSTHDEGNNSMPRIVEDRNVSKGNKPAPKKNFAQKSFMRRRRDISEKMHPFPSQGRQMDAPMMPTYGGHAVDALLSHGASGATALFFQENRKDSRTLRILRQAEGHKVPLHPVSRKTLDEMTGGARHQGFVLYCANPEPTWQPDHLSRLLRTLSEPALLLVLDGVQDPHNLGACLRSADGAGAHAVVSPRDRAAGLTPTVRKVACGASESVPLIRIVNLARTLDELRNAGVATIGLSGEADESLYEIDMTGPAALVLGGEERGLRRLTRANCDRLARLPMLGAVENLNVSVAAGISLYEVRRQRESHRYPPMAQDKPSPP